jgi:UV DNA damage endonuclease
MIRFGLCCLFRTEPVRFRHATATHVLKMPDAKRIAHLSEICRENAESLGLAIRTAAKLGIRAFRILSPLFPLYTHPDAGFDLDSLPDAARIRAALADARFAARTHDVRLSFHPDQFILLNSPRQDVVESAIHDLEYQSMLSSMVGADVINIHLGGTYGDKPAAIRRFLDAVRSLDASVKSLLSLENDDRSYSPEDILPVCSETGIPMVYDVHHHRCLPDRLSVEEATRLAFDTWNVCGREPYCHISSPRSGWDGNGDPRPHADFIDIRDFPECWLTETRCFTLDVEAKAKEPAVLKLMQEAVPRVSDQA